MKRRTLLRGLPAAGAFALTGCLADGADQQSPETDETTDDPASTDRETDTDGSADTGTDAPEDIVTEPGSGSATPSDTPDETATETPDGDRSTPTGIADESLTVRDSGCGTADDEASITFGTDDDVATITGTIWGDDACHTAVISDVRLDGGALTVVVGSERTADQDTACADCIASIDYEATVAFDGGLPTEATVVHAHDGEDTQVASTRR